jgi:predicted transcriptional regulator of viral defense system
MKPGQNIRAEGGKYRIQYAMWESSKPYILFIKGVAINSFTALQAAQAHASALARKHLIWSEPS